MRPLSEIPVVQILKAVLSLRFLLLNFKYSWLVTLCDREKRLEPPATEPQLFHFLALIMGRRPTFSEHRILVRENNYLKCCLEHMRYTQNCISKSSMRLRREKYKMLLSQLPQEGIALLGTMTLQKVREA